MDVDREEYFNNDELKIYRGEDFIVSKHIVIHQPTLGEICDYGEQKYFSMLYSLTSTPQSMKAQLWKAGVDYTTITPYSLFLSLYQMFERENTSLLFGDLDFSKFKKYKKDDKDIILGQVVDGDFVASANTNYEVSVRNLSTDTETPLLVARVGVY